MAVPALINGVNFSWLNNELLLFGKIVTGLTKITLKSKQEKQNNYGIGVDPLSRGYGNKDYEMSLEMYYDTWANIIDAAPNFDPLDIPAFDIPLVIGGPRIPQPRKIVARMCEFTEHGYDTTQNDKKIMVTIPLIVARVDWKT